MSTNQMVNINSEYVKEKIIDSGYKNAYLAKKLGMASKGFLSSAIGRGSVAIDNNYIRQKVKKKGITFSSIAHEIGYSSKGSLSGSISQGRIPLDKLIRIAEIVGFPYEEALLHHNKIDKEMVDINKEYVRKMIKDKGMTYGDLAHALGGRTKGSLSGSVSLGRLPKDELIKISEIVGFPYEDALLNFKANNSLNEVVSINSDYIKSKISENGYTQADFAKMIGLSSGNLGIRLSQKRIRLNCLKKIAHALNFSYEEALLSSPEDANKDSDTENNCSLINNNEVDIPNKTDIKLDLKTKIDQIILMQQTINFTLVELLNEMKKK